MHAKKKIQRIVLSQFSINTTRDINTEMKKKWGYLKHIEIISEGLFYRVLDVLDSKALTYSKKNKTIENFPLRGFFVSSFVRS